MFASERVRDGTIIMGRLESTCMHAAAAAAADRIEKLGPNNLTSHAWHDGQPDNLVAIELCESICVSIDILT